MSGLAGWIRIFEIASEAVKPTRVHVLPASDDLYTPSPGMMLPRMHDSPVPMKTTSGRDSETATAPTEALVIRPSVTGAHFMPPSIVFQRPPPTAPKYASRGRPFTPATAIDRPPRSGPMLRHLKDERIACSNVSAAADDCAARSARAPNRAAAETTSSAAQAMAVRYLDNPNMAVRLLEREQSSI